jgi:hypothetical protein
MSHVSRFRRESAIGIPRLGPHILNALIKLKILQLFLEINDLKKTPGVYWLPYIINPHPIWHLESDLVYRRKISMPKHHLPTLVHTGFAPLERIYEK